jgi:6-pyruvoyltetrahydropterin/6-carboxytetrahydropterin synthase
MFSVCKEFRFAAAHRIEGHPGLCAKLHGHSYRVRVWAEAETLDRLGMVVDFFDLQKVMDEVIGPFDHSYLNEVPPFDSTTTSAEELARYVFTETARRVDDGRVRISRVEVWESESAFAAYEPRR